MTQQLTQEQIDSLLNEAKGFVNKATGSSGELKFGQAIKQELISSSERIQNIIDSVLSNAGVMTPEQASDLDEQLRLAKKRLLESQQKISIQNTAIIVGVAFVSLSILWVLTRNK